MRWAWMVVVACVDVEDAQGAVTVVGVVDGQSWCEQGRPMRFSLSDVA